MKKQILISCLLIFTLPTVSLKASDYRFTYADCSVSLKNDTLCVQNSVIKRVWLWNGGNLITHSLTDIANGEMWNVANTQPDLFLPGNTAPGENATIGAKKIAASLQHTEQVQIVVEYSTGSLDVRKILKVYPGCPAIACELYMKGKAAQTWVRSVENAADLQNIEKLTTSNELGKVPVIEYLAMPGRHWTIETVEFLDITDRFNTLVRPVRALSYNRDCIYRGNILYAENSERGAGFFMLKEAPTSNVQLHYPNGDFLVGGGIFSMMGLGIDSLDLKPDEWTRAYGYVTGVYGQGRNDKLMALRDYQMRIRPMLADRDEMLMLNTWGDRGQDTRVNEAFCLNELELSARLGITHFQIDDGWQAGRSANSAYGGSFKNIWDNPDYWTPDKGRFPNGLEPIVKRGNELGIEVCLWFNPSIQDDYADWEKDAEALISLYERHGIRTFKIDGTAIPNKLSEIRLRRLYDKVMEATGWKAVLNLDATAGRRGGYFFFNEYGNIFLENRYTDWNNYYPYWTLRNLWMLSRYLPPQMLQMEFLNIWRNTEKYAGDRFAPANYRFDYVFATTMAAQPLAWFEAANLPDKAYAVGDLIGKYKTVRYDFHTGYIFPLGDEPSGKSWCGFQSIKEDSGYFLIYREDNASGSCDMATYLPANAEVELTSVAGGGESFRTKTGKNGVVSFSLPAPNSFALYKYRVF